MIPILCGFYIIQLKEFFRINNKKIIYLFLLFILFITFKYNDVYNVDRKFMDLQNVDLSTTVKANELDKKFNKLRWITPFEFSKDPKQELILLRNSLEILKENKEKEIMVITHYQFFSTILEKNLNIPNRWYFPGNNTYPSSNNNKYRDNYIEKFYKLINKKNIKTIYVIESRNNEFQQINFKSLLKKNCFKKKRFNKILYSINIHKCN